jgi:hypothetical protein
LLQRPNLSKRISAAHVVLEFRKTEAAVSSFVTMLNKSWFIVAPR